MKKTLFILLGFIFVLVLCSCNNKDNNNTLSFDSKSTNETTSFQANSTTNPEPSQSTITSTDSLYHAYSITESKTIYASPNGNGIGTKTNPTTLSNAISKINDGTYTTAVLEVGTYTAKRLNLSSNGTANERLQIICPNGIAKLDFQGTEQSVNVWGNYWHLYGLMAYDSSDKGFHISGDNNILEHCIACFSRNTGIRIGGSSQETFEDWPKNNYIYNCTSFSNCDAAGENADGFSCNLNTANGNVFDGCIAYENCDDGWDLFTKRTFGAIGSVVIKNCIAFNNGWITDKNGVQSEQIGDGNGFKLGGSAIEVNHTITNCIAYDNFANGFDDNSNPGTLTITNCTSYNNGLRNIAMGRFATDNATYNKVWDENGVSYGPITGINKSHNIFKNIISYSTAKTQISDSYVGQSANCYFSGGLGGTSFQTSSLLISVNSHTSSKGVSTIIATSPFVSVVAPYNNLLEVDEKLRDSNYNLKLDNFLKTNSSFEEYGAKY